MTPDQFQGSWAEFDRSRTYRYSLGRVWDPAKPRVAFVMLNPSVADLDQLDPTVRRCVGFAKDWGYGSLEVGNLFAIRSTDPVALYQLHPEPIGWSNDAALLRIQRRSKEVIVAWGNHGWHLGRGDAVLDLLRANGPVRCLGYTKQGQPAHPLYLKATTERRPL
ncbi:MAG: DUF1643 domain-containing protein [Euryarchaeota archaeon]|nr:DUF1643 domain-containing protein [Euryarchaeota archaeon]MDE1836631.1 DUF1643 domain-containing protein [Euryarchaeota archaeon]MDE1879174.1 DUF1643 domain-containing protein [Euryarchaeota archaeon]MDE2044601.1 DUF1643 domain-containing protein [Thermoplasmata archaeon]